MRLIVIGLSLSSAWGNGHATTWRALLRAFAARGHDIVFLERDVPWYGGEARDLVDPSWCTLAFYHGLDELAQWRERIARADAVVVGSYVPEGVAVGRLVQSWARGVTAFYDIDTPVTLAALARGECRYVDRGLVAGYDCYLSFTGGPTLARLEREFGAKAARALYCSVDADAYQPVDVPTRWDLGYLGTYSDDRQPALERLLLDVARREPARRFVVAGPQYPDTIDWPANVERIEHVAPGEHAAFYSACRFTLNVTRADMIRAGWSPSVRLFEAAACGAPIVSDAWAGIETLLAPPTELAVARTTDEVRVVLNGTSEPRRRAWAAAARQRVLREHTAEVRAAQFEQHLREACERTRTRRSSRTLRDVHEALA